MIMKQQEIYTLRNRFDPVPYNPTPQDLLDFERGHYNRILPKQRLRTLFSRLEQTARHVRKTPW
mgnify:CR=1 FL=1